MATTGLKMNKYVLKAVIDGVLQFFGLKFVFAISESIYKDPYKDFSLTILIVTDIIVSAILTIIYFLLLLNEFSNKKILLFSLCSVGCFLLSELLNFCFIMVFPICSISDNNPALGLVLLISIAVFITSLLIFKLCTLMILIFRNKNQKNQKNYTP